MIQAPVSFVAMNCIIWSRKNHRRSVGFEQVPELLQPTGFKIGFSPGGLTRIYAARSKVFSTR
jgi:hypothetical protein